MANEDDAYYDDDGFGDPDWLYIEDSFPLADELAESQLPDPSYAGVNDDLYNQDEFDLYEYWFDMDYGDNEYWDSEGIFVPAIQKQGQKKRKTAVGSTARKRKLSLKDTEDDVVRYMPVVARVKLGPEVPTKSREVRPYALLPDWSTRFKDVDGSSSVKPMPADMKKASEQKGDDTPRSARHAGVMIADECGGEEEWEDEDEGDATQNQDALLSILAERLKGTPLAGMGKDLLMQTLSGLLSGEGSSAALDDLTSGLLGQATEGNDDGVSDWLSQQGVSLAEAEDDGDKETSIEVAHPRASAVRHSRRSTQASPHDSAIGNKEMALHGSSPSSAKKRAAPSEEGSAGKRKRVAFVEIDDAHTIPSFAPPSEGGGESINVAAPMDKEEDNITIADSTVANKKAMGRNKLRSASLNHAPSADILTEDGDDPEANEIDDNINVQAAPSRAPSVRKTRKRKADKDDVEVDGIGPMQKRQARQTAATQASNDASLGRRTRSARAKLG